LIVTIVLGLRCRSGIVLAADSQRTEGGFREPIQKLFATGSGITWGTAGSIPVQQALHGLMRQPAISPAAPLGDVQDAIVAAVAAARRRVRESIDRESDVADLIAGLFAWRGPDGLHLLRVPHNNPSAFATRFDAVGNALKGDRTLFAFSRSAHLGYDTLPIGAATMVAHSIADDVIRASPSAVGGPVQIALVTDSEALVMPEPRLQLVRDSVDAFREHQREFIVRDETPAEEGDTGVRP